MRFAAMSRTSIPGRRDAATTHYSRRLPSPSKWSVAACSRDLEAQSSCSSRELFVVCGKNKRGATFTQQRDCRKMQSVERFDHGGHRERCTLKGHACAGHDVDRLLDRSELAMGNSDALIIERIGKTKAVNASTRLHSHHFRSIGLVPRRPMLPNTSLVEQMAKHYARVDVNLQRSSLSSVSSARLSIRLSRRTLDCRRTLLAGAVAI